MHATRLIAVLLCAVLGCAQPLRHRTGTFQSCGARVTLDEYASRAQTRDAPAVILLYGSGGLQSSGLPFADEARLIARLGYRVYLPHYLDVTRGRANKPALHYKIWALTVRNALEHIQSQTGIRPSRTAILGYSLGGSVALAVAATEPRLAGVVVWSGSMPDAYRDVKVLPRLLIVHGGRDSIIPPGNARQLAALCTMEHLPCELSIYFDEGHAFSPRAIARANGQVQAFLTTVLRPD